MNETRTPTQRQFGAYQAAYDYFNAKLFGGSLTPSLLNFRGRGRGNLGLFWPEKWKSGDATTHEIALNPEALDRPLVEALATLVHEMVHQWQQDFGEPPQGNYHDKEWGRKMDEVGLTPSNTGAPGGKRTGRQMTHYVTPGGAFEAAVASMPDEIALPWLTGGAAAEGKAPSKNKNKVKYVCPCGVIVWGKAGIVVVCGQCREEFTAPD